MFTYNVKINFFFVKKLIIEENGGVWIWLILVRLTHLNKISVKIKNTQLFKKIKILKFNINFKNKKNYNYVTIYFYLENWILFI